MLTKGNKETKLADGSYFGGEVARGLWGRRGPHWERTLVGEVLEVVSSSPAQGASIHSGCCNTVLQAGHE